MALEVTEPAPGEFQLVTSDIPAKGSRSIGPQTAPQAKPSPTITTPILIDRAAQSATDSVVGHDTAELKSHTIPDNLVDGFREILSTFRSWAAARFNRSRTTEGIPGILAGYKLDAFLGQSEHWITYRARQIVTGRLTTIKVLNKPFDQNPVLVAKLARESYIGAQLANDSLAKPIEFGEAQGFYFFSREYVEGKSLGEELDKTGRIHPRLAAAYILQAARGLKFAHGQNVIHGNIKPENLILTPKGQIKICDFEVVVHLVHGSRSTVTNGGLDVPTSRPVGGRVPDLAFRSSEQRSDASIVDGRSDIYALGVIFSHLIADPASRISESAQLPDSRVPPAQQVQPASLVGRIPGSPVEVLDKMISEHPAERFQSMEEVIGALEGFLGLNSRDEFMPPNEISPALDEGLRHYLDSPMISLRRVIQGSFLVTCLVFSLLFLWAGRPSTSLWISTLCLLSFCFSICLRGIADRTTISNKFREFLRLSRPSDWLSLIASLIVGCLLLYVLGWTFATLALIVTSMGFASGLYLGLDRPLAKLKFETLGTIDPILTSMRRMGVREEAIRGYVRSLAGRDWEFIDEALFGQEPPRPAPEGLGTSVRTRWFWAWRRLPHDWIESRIQKRLDESDWAKLQRVEETAFIAEGMNLVTARRRARKTASAMIQAAGELRESARLAQGDPHAIVVRPRPISDLMREAANRPDHILASAPTSDRYPALPTRILGLLAGGTARFLFGACLIWLCLLWAHQNEIFSADEVRTKVEAVIETRDFESARDIKIDLAKRVTKPLSLEFLPSSIARRIDGFGTGVAGLLLVISSFASGLSILLFAVPAAGVAFFSASLPLPGVDRLGPEYMGMALGGIILLVGLILDRRSK